MSSLLGSEDFLQSSVNSSHHQAIRKVGENLLVSAVCPVDGVIEAVELNSSDHFVMAVQWHPERTYAKKTLSRAIFAAFIKEAEAWEHRRAGDSVAAS